MKRTKEDSKITREKLLSSALNLFIREGFSNVSMNSIAEFAGLTRGSFYWHFKSKEDILVAVIEREIDFIQNLMVELFIRKDISPNEQIKAIVQGIIINYYHNKRYKKFVELTWFKMEYRRFTRIIELKKIANEFFIEELDKVIQKGKKDGSIDTDVSAFESALQICTMINGIYYLHYITPNHMTETMAMQIMNKTIMPIIKTPK